MNIKKDNISRYIYIYIYVYYNDIYIYSINRRKKYLK